MTWLYNFTAAEIFFLVAYVVLYLLFIGRTFWLAHQLKSSAWAVIPKFFLRSSYLALLFIALLGPSFGVSEQTVKADSRDLFVVIDLSRSMDATDAVPTRLERVKFDLRQLADSLAGDRFGLIGVGDEPFLLTPLTTDRNALLQTAQGLRTNFGGSGGTNLCAGLELASQKIMNKVSSRQMAKGIVLFSDGENPGDCEQRILNNLRSYKIPLLIVGVGSLMGSTIREGNDFIRDENGQIVRSRLNVSFLTSLARQTNGRFVQATQDEGYINELIQTIREMRGTLADEAQIVVTTNKYYYFLVIALILMALDVVVTVRTFRL